MKVFEVFVPVGFPQYTYVDRPSLDRTLEAWVGNPAKHLLIFGPSKSGKTSLWKKHVLDSNAIKIGCNEEKTKDELYKEILFHLDVYYDSQIKIGATVDASLAASLKAFLGAFSTKGQVSVGHTSETTKIALSTPPITANLVAKYLEPSKRTVILEDFHYSSNELKKGLAQDLKVFSDERTAWIIVGVQHKTSELLSYNSELQLRIAELPVESFTREQLRSIFTKASSHLKVAFSSSIQDRIIDESNGSASLAQSISLKLCQIASLTVAQENIVVISREDLFETACREVAEEQKVYYEKLVRHISQGGRSDGTTEKYKWFLKLIRDVAIPDTGLKNTQVFHEIQSLGHQDIEQGSVTSGLGYLPKLLSRGRFPSFFDYDEGTKTFYLMDRYMRFVFRWIPEIVDDLFREDISDEN